MTIVVLLISVSLVIAVGFLISFLWNVKSGQYDDTYSPSVRMLFEDKPVKKITTTNQDGKSSSTGSAPKKV